MSCLANRRRAPIPFRGPKLTAALVAARQVYSLPERRRVLARTLKLVAFFILSCAVLAGQEPAAAQTYPERPITFIVPYGAGGPLDTVARIVTERMRVSLKQTTAVGVGRAVRA